MINNATRPVLFHAYIYLQIYHIVLQFTIKCQQ